jgi:hypothetical protein
VRIIILPGGSNRPTMGANSFARCAVFDDLPRLVYRCAQIIVVVMVVSVIGMLVLKALRPGL